MASQWAPNCKQNTKGSYKLHVDAGGEDRRH